MSIKQEPTTDSESFFNEKLSNLEAADPFTLSSGVQTKCELGSYSGSDCGDNYIVPDLVARDFVEEEVKPVLHIELREDPSRNKDIGSFEEEDPLAFLPRDSLGIEVLRNAERIKNEVQHEQTQQFKQVSTRPEMDSYKIHHIGYTNRIGDLGSYKKKESELSPKHTLGDVVWRNMQKSENDIQHEQLYQLAQDDTQTEIYPYKISPTDDTNVSIKNVYNILRNYKNGAYSNEKGNGLPNNLTSQPKTNTNDVVGSRKAELRNKNMSIDTIQHSHGTSNETHLLSNKSCLAKSKTTLCNEAQCTETQFECILCKKSFSFYSKLKVHNLIHTGERPYQCEVCKESFNQKSILKRHIQKHTGERPYQCDVCKQSFQHKSHLNNHTRTHTGERPYQCDVCKQSFKEKTSLNRHIRTHTGERRHQCDVCKQSFHQKFNLNVHARIHTEEWPYQCNECKQSFNRKSSLNIHIQTHTGEWPYQCDVCSCSFKHKSSLTKHGNIHIG